MASAADHIAHASRTQRALAALIEDKSPHSEWIVTASFYKAVHLAEALFAHADPRHGHSHNHDSRLDRLKGDHPEVFVPFKALYDLSRLARYLELAIPNRPTRRLTSFDQYLPPERVAPEVLDKRLLEIERLVVKVLGDSATDLERVNQG